MKFKFILSAFNVPDFLPIQLKLIQNVHETFSITSIPGEVNVSHTDNQKLHNIFVWELPMKLEDWLAV